MELLIKNYLKEYFKLPDTFIRPDAQLNILAILSLYFNEKREQTIKPSDIDPEKLSIEIEDLEYIEEKNKIYFDLRKLLKKPSDSKIVFTDHIGRDGFCEFSLHWILAIMELPEKIGKEPMSEYILENAQTVGNIFKAYGFSHNFSSN